MCSGFIQTHPVELLVVLTQLPCWQCIGAVCCAVCDITHSPSSHTCLPEDLHVFCVDVLAKAKEGRKKVGSLKVFLFTDAASGYSDDDGLGQITERNGEAVRLLRSPISVRTGEDQVG